MWQELAALMPSHSAHIETHLGGGAVTKCKRTAPHNFGIDLVGRSLSSFACDYPVELVYSDPPYLRGGRRSGCRYRHDYGDVGHVALLGLLRRLPCSVMVSRYPSGLHDRLRGD